MVGVKREDDPLEKLIEEVHSQVSDEAWSKMPRNFASGGEPMTVSREAIGDAVLRWEKKAKDEMFLDAFLHPMARQWLLDEIVVALKSHAQSAPESSEVESSRVESGTDLGTETVTESCGGPLDPSSVEKWRREPLRKPKKGN
jgi:hypothetical protein